MRLCVYTIFDPGSGRPLITGIRNSGTGASSIFELYLPKSGRSIYDVEQDEARITKVLIGAQRLGMQIVTSDWKDHVRHFKLPHCRAKYNAYDLQLNYPDVSDPKRAKNTMVAMLERMCDYKISEWQRVLADAGVVYQDLQDTGLLQHSIMQRPLWSQRTSTGRSKCKGFNIQGIDKSSRYHIRSPHGADEDKLLLFDWISADIRFAGLFADDDILDAAFRSSDPYTLLANELGLERDECKVGLLKAINSMNTDSPVFLVYPKLGLWIDRCRAKLSIQGGYLDTFLGRRFRMREDSNKLQILNGCMQGSVAHAMQLVVRRIWEELGPKLIAEVHDSLVVSSPPELVQSTIDIVSEIMLRPFDRLYSDGVVMSNPDFPFKVHVGDLWHGWELRSVYRSGIIEQVSSGKYTQSVTTASGAGTSASEEEAGTSGGMAYEGDGSPSRDDINGWFTPNSGVR